MVPVKSTELSLDAPGRRGQDHRVHQASSTMGSIHQIVLALSGAGTGGGRSRFWWKYSRGFVDFWKFHSQPACNVFMAFAVVSPFGCQPLSCHLVFIARSEHLFRPRLMSKVTLCLLIYRTVASTELHSRFHIAISCRPAMFAACFSCGQATPLS